MLVYRLSKYIFSIYSTFVVLELDVWLEVIVFIVFFSERYGEIVFYFFL